MLSRRVCAETRRITKNKLSQRKQSSSEENGPPRSSSKERRRLRMNFLFWETTTYFHYNITYDEECYYFNPPLILEFPNKPITWMDQWHTNINNIFKNSFRSMLPSEFQSGGMYVFDEFLIPIIESFWNFLQQFLLLPVCYFGQCVFIHGRINN